MTNGSGAVTDSAISNIAVDCFSLAVTSSTPAAGATDVSRTEPLVLNFSAPLNELTVAQNWVDLLGFPNGHRLVDLSVSGSQLTLTPRLAMLPGAAYTLEVRPGIRAVGGEGLAETVRVEFSTREAAWRGAQNIAHVMRPGGRVYSPHISSNGGTFVTVWREYNSALGLNRYSPDTGWDTAAVLYTGYYIRDPQVFLDDAGTAHVIWEHNDGTLVSSRHTRDAGWSAIEQVPTDGTGKPLRWKGAMDDAGNIFAIWKSEAPTGINSIWVNRYVPDSGWQTPVQLDDDAGGFVTDVGVTVDSAGNAVAYWLLYQVHPRYITARRYTRSSGWGPAEIASANNVRDKSTPHMVTWGGETVAVYSREGTSDILAVTDRGGWQTPQSIGTGLAGVGHGPRVAFDDAGNDFAVWIQRGNGPTDEVWGNARSAGGVWSTPRRIAVSTEKFTDPGHQRRLGFRGSQQGVHAWG